MVIGNEEPYAVYRHVSVRLGSAVVGSTGTLYLADGVAEVRTARWLPRFLGGSTAVRQVGGVVEPNIAHAGGRFIFTDGTRTVICAFGPRRAEDVAVRLRAAGFEVATVKSSMLTAEQDHGLSRPGDQQREC